MEISVVWLITCGIIGVGALSREMFLWFRNLIPKSVQCWFCHHKTEVPYTLSNCWHCPKCEQYNGFMEDGDYNKPIQQQYDERLNFAVSNLGGRKGVWRRGNVLCSDCNRIQELKVQQLAAFEPINPRKYDQEVEHFRAQIEKAFTLCRNCELMINAVVRKEREELGVPRRLNTSTIRAARGTWILYVQLLLAALLALIGFIQTGAASSLKALARPVVASFLKTQLPFVYPALRSAPSAVVKSNLIGSGDYVIVAGMASSLLAYYVTGRSSVALLFHSLMSLALLGLSLGYKTEIECIPSIEVVAGITLFVVTFGVLKKIYSDVGEYQRRQQMMLIPKTPKTLQRSYCSVPFSSTPRNTPPESHSFTYEDAPAVPMKSVSPRIRLSPAQLQPCNVDDASSFVSLRSRGSVKARSSLRDVGLEPGIQGLTLGSAARDDDVRSVWNGSVVHSTFSIPNSSSWTAFSGRTQFSTQSVPVNFGGAPLQHIYSPSSRNNVSRPPSPGSGKNVSRPPSPASFFNRSTF